MLNTVNSYSADLGSLVLIEPLFTLSSAAKSPPISLKNDAHAILWKGVSVTNNIGCLFITDFMLIPYFSVLVLHYRSERSAI